jgi:ParB family chromosome partitioning protein
MGKDKKIPFNMPSVDDLFTTQEERDDAKREKVYDIPLSEIDPFPEHPYKIRTDEAFDNLTESISTNGVLTPAVARRKDDGRYELVSGHRRLYASELAGLATLPVIVREMTHDEAVIAMVDANLQREDVLPSEKAFSYKMKLDALKRQGKRTDLTCSPPGNKLQGKKSLDVVGEEAGDSRNTVHRYIRLTELLPEILDLVDTGKVAMRPAVEISYLPKEQQAQLLDAMESEVCTPSHAQAIKLRHFSEDSRLNPDVILSIMSEEKPNQVEQLKIPKDRISKFFKQGTPTQKIEDTIVKALELYRKHERSRGMER